MLLLAWMTWPFFLDSFLRNEGSPNAGGLLRWPVKLLLPLGFGLIALQGISELIKRSRCCAASSRRPRWWSSTTAPTVIPARPRTGRSAP